MSPILTRIFQAAILIPVILAIGNVNAAIYKCKNDKGQIEFKQMPCQGESLKVFNEQGRKQRTSKGGVSYSSNSITANDVMMPVESAVAVYFKDKNKINVFFSMRELSMSEIEQLKDDKASFLMWGQSSPDFEKWKKYPSADMNIYFKENRPHTPENVNMLDFHFNNLTKEPSQNKISLKGKDVTDNFQKFDLKIDGKRSKLVLDFIDEKPASGVNYQWSLSFDVPIILVY